MCETTHQSGLLSPEQQFETVIFAFLSGESKILVNVQKENHANNSRKVEAHSKTWYWEKANGSEPLTEA